MYYSVVSPPSLASASSPSPSAPSGLRKAKYQIPIPAKIAKAGPQIAA